MIFAPYSFEELTFTNLVIQLQVVIGLGRQARSKTTCVLRITSKGAGVMFIINGSILLERLIGSWNGKCCPIRSFSAKELEQATNDCDPVNVVGDEGECEWYKGFIKGRIVSIKKYNDNRYGAFDDIAVAAQLTAHNNILRLIGCCLETHIPIAVYEFAESGTLSSHIHIAAGTNIQPLSWKSRLRIATEIASAIAYLHTASRNPIIHKDIKPSNVFLDQDNVAKLSGFETSIAIPEGETHVNEYRLSGTYAYLSPEYRESGVVTEKFDVYSFGVLFMELLSGRKPYGDGLELRTFFETHVLSNEDNQVLDPTILQEVVGQIDVQRQVREVSELALRCTERDMEERPTMLDVARQLLQLRRTMVSH